MRIPPRFRAPFLIAAATALTLGVTSGCNIFDPIDSPDGDAQLLSAARACLDQADYACALESYGKLSADSNDVKLAEEAYTILAQNEAGFGPFASAFGKDPNGKGLTKLANALVAGAGKARRVDIHGAFKKADSITDANTKNLVRFLSAAALAGEMLAEAAGADGVVTATDLAVSASCSTSNCALDLTNAICGAGTGSIPASATNADITTATPDGATPTLDQLYSAINQAQLALSALGSSSQGSFNGLLGGAAASPNADPAAARCVRGGLISQGIGG